MKSMIVMFTGVLLIASVPLTHSIDIGFIGLVVLMVGIVAMNFKGNNI